MASVALATGLARTCLTVEGSGYIASGDSNTSGLWDVRAEGFSYREIPDFEFKYDVTFSYDAPWTHDWPDVMNGKLIPTEDTLYGVTVAQAQDYSDKLLEKGAIHSIRWEVAQDFTWEQRWVSHDFLCS